MSTPDILASVIISVLALLLLLSYKKSYILRQRLERAEEEVEIVHDNRIKKEEWFRENFDKEYRKNKSFREKVELLIYGNWMNRQDHEIIQTLIIKMYGKPTTLDPRPSEQPESIPRAEQQPPAEPQGAPPEAGTHARECIGGQGLRGGSRGA